MHEPSQIRCGRKHAHCTPEKVSMIVGTFERNRVRFLMGCPVGPRSPMAHWSKSTTSTPSYYYKNISDGLAPIREETKSVPKFKEYEYSDFELDLIGQIEL